jgi:histidinol-phosphate aminotransferase
MTLAAPSVQPFVDPGVTALPRPGRSSRRGLLDLSRNELVHPELDPLVATVLAGVSAGTATRYAVYPELIAELAPELGCDADELEIFPGSDDAIGVLVDALGRDDRRMLLQEPNYPGYRYHAQLRGVEVSPWLPRPGLLRYEAADAVRFMRRERPAVIVLTEPHGGLGSSMGELELIALVTAAEQHGHLLVVDECYRGFAVHPDGEVLDGREHVLRVGSFSKSIGLAGLRLGYVIGHPVLIDYLRRWRRAGAVSALTARVALHVLRHHAPAFARLRAEVADGRDWLAGQLVARAPDWRPLPSRANFLTVDLGEEERAAELVTHLARHAIAVRAHDRAAFASLVQITAAPPALLHRVVDAITQLKGA